MIGALLTPNFWVVQHFTRVESLVDNFVEKFTSIEVLVVEFRITGWVYPNKVAFSIVFLNCLMDYIPKFNSATTFQSIRESPLVVFILVLINQFIYNGLCLRVNLKVWNV